MPVSRRTATAYASAVSRKLRKEGFCPLYADQRVSLTGIRLQGNSFQASVDVLVDFDGAHKRRRMAVQVRETLVELGYEVDESREILVHTDEEIEAGHDFYGLIKFHAWLPGWRVPVAA